MKYLIILLPLTLLFGCSDNKQAETEIKTTPVAVEQPLTEQSTEECIKYTTVTEMLKEAGDFTEEDGSLKILSKDEKPIHVQVSKIIFDGDIEKVIIEQTMRDIVYVAFQAFAQTNIDEITVTSIPMKGKDKLVGKYKMTVTINREAAKTILKKYLSTDNFQVLYYLDGTLWLPSKKFDSLKFQNLDAVFADMG
jgi:hypothetical protein